MSDTEEPSKFEVSSPPEQPTTAMAPEEPAPEEGPDVLKKLKAASDEDLPEAMAAYQAVRDRYSEEERATVDAYLKERLNPTPNPHT